MSDLIIGVIVDVDGHVFIQYLNRLGICFIAGPARNFVILDATEFIVLDPKVGLEDFHRRWKPEEGCVSPRETTACLGRSGAGQ